jgi:predicted NBD/HSP70 family sugar kinase/biotin operon repressor
MSRAEDLRTRNVEVLVDALRHHGRASRTDLASATGLSRSTVVSIVDELAERGLIVESQAEGGQRGRGRPATLIRLNTAAGVALGVFVGRDDMRVVLTDMSLTALGHRHVRFELGTPAEALVDVAHELARTLLDEAGVSRRDLVGVGVGLSSPVDPASGTVDPVLLPSWAERPVRDLFATRLGAPAAVENDANLEALAELAMGAGKGLRHYVYIKASWGIGAGIVVGGRLRRGSTGYAGELVHTQLRDGGPVCGCGRRGCVNSLASGHRLAEGLEAVHGSHLTLEDIVRLAADGDGGARRVLADAGRVIGEALAPVCNVLNPQAAIIGGELAPPGSPLIAGVAEAVERFALPAAAEAMAVRAAELQEIGGALGAAGLVVRSDEAARRLATLAG